MANAQLILKTSIWETDFSELSSAAQHLFIFLGSQKSISLCGVLPLSTKRWAKLSKDGTPKRVRAALNELATTNPPWVLVDEDTEEVMLRTYVRNAGALKMPNIVVGLTRDYTEILSHRLRMNVLAQVQDKDLAGIEPGRIPDLFLCEYQAISNGLTNPLTKAITKGEGLREPMPIQPITDNRQPTKSKERPSVFENAENPKSCSPSAQTSKQASMPAKPKNEIWDTAHDLATELWPDSPPGTRKGWAGEITKLVKRTGNDPASLTRLGAAIIGHHGLRGLGQLSNPTRAALMARLPQILNLQPNPQTLADRWATVVKPSRRTDLGGQLELLLTGWDHRPATNDRPWSAAHRQRTVAENYLAKLADALAVTEPSKRRFEPTNQSGPTAIDAVSVLNNLKGTA
jgi:hypothetical protein